MGPAGQDPLPLLLVVDAANVVGSVPDGWWRDRAGATRRLRDRLVRVAAEGYAEKGGESEPVEVVLVVEGAARETGPVAGVRIAAAPQGVPGDDEIVRVVAEREPAGRAVTVVTADRELRRRVAELGASVLGPRVLPR